jgi:Ca2+-binding RTX toxin-like protein
VVTLLGDDDGNVLTSSRNAAGAILINGGTIAIQGGIPTVANTILIEAVGRGGNDTLALDEASGALPRASFTGGVGNDVLRGGSGDDLLYGGDDHDLLQGNGGADVLVGGAGNDQLEGGAGDDQMFGGVGNDTLLGGAGNDYISWIPGDGSDVVEGGSGFDTLDFSGSISGDLIGITASGARVDVGLNISIPLDLDDVERIRVRSLNGPDNIYVGDLGGTDVTQVAINLAVTPDGSAGDGLVDEVSVDGTAGGDNISFALAGTVVTVNGLPAQVTIDHADATDQLLVNGLAGNDRIDASALAATSLRLTIDGGTGNDTLFGSAGGDSLYGGDDNDTLVGRGGLDWTDLGPGDDRFV